MFLRKAISVSSSGDNLLIAGVTGRSIAIVEMQLVMSAGAETVTIYDGPASSGTALSGAMGMSKDNTAGPNVLTFPPPPANPAGGQEYIFETSQGNAFNLNLSSNVAITGWVVYAEISV